MSVSPIAALTPATFGAKPVLLRLIRPISEVPAEKVGTSEAERGNQRWIWPLLVFLSAAGLTFTAIYINGLRSANGVAVPHFVQTMLPDATLGLRVEFEGEHLLVAWNRRSAAVRNAVAGVLLIEDGGERRNVHLDNAQVAAGSLLYRPASDDITFRLELYGEEGNKTVESLRVLSPRDAPENPPGASRADSAGARIEEPSGSNKASAAGSSKTDGAGTARESTGAKRQRPASEDSGNRTRPADGGNPDSQTPP